MARGKGLSPTRRHKPLPASGPMLVDTESYLRYWLRRPAGMTTRQTDGYLKDAPGISRPA